MNEADTLKQEYFKLRNEGGSIFDSVQYGVAGVISSYQRWDAEVDAFISKWDMATDSIKAEACPDADRNFKAQIFSQRDLISKAVDLCVSSKSNELNGRKADFTIVDEIIEERGKIHGDANNSGMFFCKGIDLLRTVNEKSDIARSSAFDGHMYMAMFKMVRLMYNPYHRDNYDDLLGYLKLAMTALEDKS